MSDWVGHYECGRHSGIPECCVDWYLGPWSNAVSVVPYLWEAYWKSNNEPKAPDYIRCPSCIESRRVMEVKECNCHESR